MLVRSSTGAGPGLGTVNRYFLYVLAANALLCAATVWAARWIGGPRRPSRAGRAPVITLYGGDGCQNLKSTFTAQLLTRRGGVMVGLYEVFHARIGGPMGAEADYQDSLAHRRKAIASCPAPPAVLVGDPWVAARLGRDLAAGGARRPCSTRR